MRSLRLTLPSLSRRNAFGSLVTRWPRSDGPFPKWRTAVTIVTQGSMSFTRSKLEEQLLNEIETQPVVIFGKSDCKACASAEKKFKKLGVEPTVFHLDLGQSHEAAIAMSFLEELTNGAPLPHVFVVGAHLNGSEAVDSKLKGVKEVVDRQILKLRVMHEIDINPVVIFSKAYCPMSAQTKQAFQDMEVDIAIFDLDSDKVKGNVRVAEDLQIVLADMTGRHSLPSVFVGGNFLGGSEEIAALVSSNKLRSSVDAAILACLGS